MKFIDKTEVIVAAGKGGDGMCCFRTARNRPKLGPDGGNGGNGGNVVFVADRETNTLSRLRYRTTYQAENGGKGGSNNKTGRCGQDCEIPVPLGTILYDSSSGNKVGEILVPEDRLLVARGGKRGYGNRHFILPTRQAPRMSTKGSAGERVHLNLELKLLADVGLAGFPNAGKSTLLSAVSAAKPKIADYPFTTLVPNLGVVESGASEKDWNSLVLADIPGLIEGASQGKGLGLDFLRHIERTRVIACVLDAGNSDSRQALLKEFDQLNKELGSYSDALSKKPKLILLNKVDLIENSATLNDLCDAIRDHTDVEHVLPISGATSMGLVELKQTLFALVTSEKTLELTSCSESSLP